jgi:GntR family transcriptional regulator
MQFREHQAIYLQIADLVRDKILTGQWAPGEKILSVRDLGMEVQVNPNTVVRSYEILEQQNVIFNRRGLGFFVSEDAVLRIRAMRRERFLSNDLPELIRTMHLLGVTPEEVQKQYDAFELKP